MLSLAGATSGVATHDMDSFSALLQALGEEHNRVVKSLLAQSKSLAEELDRQKCCETDVDKAQLNATKPFAAVLPAARSSSLRSLNKGPVAYPDGAEGEEGDGERKDAAEADRGNPSGRLSFGGALRLSSAYGKIKCEMEHKAQEIEAALEIGDTLHSSQTHSVTTRWGLLGKLERLLLSPQFDLMVCFLIFLNTIIMAMETQYFGTKVGYSVRYPGFQESDYESWGDSAGDTLETIERIFTVIFACELAVRMFVFRMNYFKDVLNWLDMVVVFSGLADWIFAKFPNAAVIRVFRLLKLGRGMRLLRVIKTLDSLHILLKCVGSSLTTLVWSIGILTLIQCVAAMVFSSLVQSYLQNESNPQEDRHAVFAYYGTFTRSMLTMFEVMLANWAPSCRVLVDNVDEIYSFVFMLYRCCLGFAILNIINAVFIQQTLKSVQTCDDVLVVHKQRAQEDYANKLKKLFVRLDTSGDGFISWDEFQEMLTNKHMRTWLSVLDIEVHDLEAFFHVLDDGDGMITIDELTMGVARVKGNARALDVAHLMALVKRMDSKIDSVFRKPSKKGSSEKLPLPTKGSTHNLESETLASTGHAKAVTPDSGLQLPNSIF